MAHGAGHLLAQVGRPGASGAPPGPPDRAELLPASPTSRRRGLDFTTNEGGCKKATGETPEEEKAPGQTARPPQTHQQELSNHVSRSDSRENKALLLPARGNIIPNKTLS